MKIINVKYGIAQNINDILGNDPETPKNEGEEIEITYWSLQACLLENMRRIIKGISNSNDGRVMNGLHLTFHNGVFDISPGIGITNNGNVIYLKTGLSNISMQSLSVDVKIYLLHKTIPIDPTLLPNAGGINTTFTKKTGNEDIVHDDMVTCYGDQVNSVIDDILYISTTGDVPTVDYVYLGKHVVGEVIMRDTPFRGFGPNDNDTITIYGSPVENTMEKSNGIHSVDLSLFENYTLFKDYVIFGDNNQNTEIFLDDGAVIRLKNGSDYEEGFTGLVAFKNDQSENKNMRFIKGIFIGVE